MHSYSSSPDTDSVFVFGTSLAMRLQENVSLILGISASMVLVCVTRYLQSPWRKVPPGPPGLPFIGNALELTGDQWLRYSAWRKDYGDIIYLNAMGKPMVILNSPSIATELLDRRATIYSDRPTMIVSNEIMCDGLMLPSVSYGDKWRRMRKASHEALNKVVADGLNEYQVEEAMVLVRNTMRDAAGWDQLIRSATASMMLRGVYAEAPVLDECDARVYEVNEIAATLSSASGLGAYWVEIMPWMRHVPSVFAPWKRKAQEIYERNNALFHRLLDRVQKGVDDETEPTSFCATLIRERERYGLHTHENAWLAASIYTAGSDTVRAVLSWWTLAMLLHPEVQMRAQNELDAVVGRARLPTFSDMPHLPYVSAIIKEVIRWRPATPLGLPHRSTEDDIYEGYFIPKGTVVIPNVWEMNHDPATFGQDAHLFNPERFLGENGELLSTLPGSKDDGHYAFGFGRRICVGKHVANNSLFIDVAVSLWAFSFVNVKGQSLDADGCINEGVVVAPKHFEVDVEPRFPEALALLSQECELRGR
ncbi:unnamed protein product [Peniophora sp. CBMAI 1063]|nr:unnamed protein product [Peniophora sp. CBMAI 1063]